jgi:hypothetical protein
MKNLPQDSQCHYRSTSLTEFESFTSRHVVLKMKSAHTRGPRGLAIVSARLFLPSYYKLEQKIVALNIFNILQDLFTWNNDITNILDFILPADIYASYTVMTQP